MSKHVKVKNNMNKINISYCDVNVMICFITAMHYNEVRDEG